jgi:hypothetical protein
MARYNDVQWHTREEDSRSTTCEDQNGEKEQNGPAEKRVLRVGEPFDYDHFPIEAEQVLS